MLLHPQDNKTALTDRFGSPVEVGDTVIIAAKCHTYGSSGPVLSEGRLVKLSPLMDHPNRMGHWHSTGQKSRTPMVREDQLHKSAPTEYLMPGTENGPPDLSKAYVTAVQIDGRGRPHTVAYGWNLIKVPS